MKWYGFILVLLLISLLNIQTVYSRMAGDTPAEATFIVS